MSREEMEHTSDLLRPSSSVTSNEDMSYLFGRDPSILAYGQRPCPSQITQKNLYSMYDVDEDEIEVSENSDRFSQSLQTVKVYLRLKPFPKKAKLSVEELEAYQIINPTTLFTKFPIIENNSSLLKRPNIGDVVHRKYTFTKTFGPETTQLDLFEQAVKPQMLDFLSGQNSTIMTYGTTNSGKTYTLRGTTTSPGIIPRSLEFLFSNITPKAMPPYKPIHNCHVICLDRVERAQELEVKSKLLNFTSMERQHYINAYTEMQRLLQEESPIRPSQSTGAYYSVWVSFAEIYNETIYDLLSNDCQKKRIGLKLATDSDGRVFIKGLKSICVSSASEAYQILMAGQYNLKVAATALNSRSSRSHCIFTIKLLKYYAENTIESVDVSTFAFCDLAGSERLKKTLNIGDRLKEAQNINTSLLVLGRCLKSIHEGQLAKQKVETVGPFRESKLTRLFQRALSGKEHIALIVNINPLPNLYVETQNVLSFSAIAKKIVIEKEKPNHKSKSRFSKLVTQSIKTVTDWDTTEIENEDWQNTVDQTTNLTAQPSDDYDEIVHENECLRKEIAALKSSALTRDLQIRQEMADTYTSMMMKLETDYKNRIKDVEEQQQDAVEWSVKQVEEFYQQKIEQLCSRKRRRISNNGSEDEEVAIEELEAENSRLTKKITTLKHNMKELKQSNEMLTVEKNEATFKLALLKDELKNLQQLLDVAQNEICADEQSKQYVEELRAQLDAKQSQVKNLKAFLNEAKEEYIAITTAVNEKQRQLEEQQEALVENEEKIEELESHVEHLNIRFTEKSKAVEILEEKIENQTIKLMEAEKQINNMKKDMMALEHEKLLLVDQVEMLKTANNFRRSISQVPLEAQTDEFKTVIKQEVELNDPSMKATNELGKNSQESETEADLNKICPKMMDRIGTIESENLALKERLANSSGQIEKLRDELTLAEEKLKNIVEQTCRLQTTNVKANVSNRENTTQTETTNLVNAFCQTELTDSADVSCQTIIQNLVESECQTLLVESMVAECQTSSTKSVDVFCQVDIPVQTIEIISEEINVEDRSSQTPPKQLVEETNQTSFVEDKNDDADMLLDEWAKLVVKYDDLETKYEEQFWENEQLFKNWYINETALHRMGDTIRSKDFVIEECTQSIKLLQAEIAMVTAAKMEICETLECSNKVNAALEQKIKDYEQRLKDMETKLDSAENHTECKKELDSVKNTLQDHLSACNTNHQQTIDDLQKKLSIAKEQVEIKTQCLDVHAAKITELQHNLQGLSELQQQISQVTEDLRNVKTEKERLQRLLAENNEKILELEDRLQHAEDKERDKDEEISNLQKEMKRIIQNCGGNDKDDKIMEIELKNTIKTLAETRDLLSERDIQIGQLEIRLQGYEENAKFLQQTAQERQTRENELSRENERLRNFNDDLKKSLMEKEHEMEVYLRNRDEMVAKYEALVKTQQEELKKQTNEKLAKGNKNRKEREDLTSEDEFVPKDRRRGRKPASAKKLGSAKQEEVSVIDLSDSDSKKDNRDYFPLPEPISDKKRNPRRKKLYVQDDESFQDIEPVESTITVTPSQCRNLRTRRK